MGVYIFKLLYPVVGVIFFYHAMSSFCLLLQYLLPKVNLSDIRIATQDFFLLPFAWNTFPNSSHFQPVFIFTSEISFLQAAYIWFLCFCFIQPL